MACNGCATKFSFFKKEKGCKNCGFSFCKDCLPHKVPVPRHKNEKHEVCKKCYDILTGKTKPPTQIKYSPPENFKKRVAALSDPNAVKPLRSDVSVKTATGVPGPGTGGSGQNMGKYSGMSAEDQAIGARLERLKESRAAEAAPVPSQAEVEGRFRDLKGHQPPPPSQQEMAARLAQLKGQDPSAVNRKHVFPTDRRSEQQQIDDLLHEIHDEVEIDSHGVDPAQNIAARLAHLKGKPVEKRQGEPDVSDVHLASGTGRRSAGGGLEGEGVGRQGEEEEISEVRKMIEQATKELQLDAEKTLADLQKDEEIWNKLKELKSGKSREEMKGMLYEDDEQDDQEETDEQVERRLIKQLLEEQKLDDEAATQGFQPSQTTKVNLITKSKDEPEEDPDELPYCCICNEDATLRCPGCEGDLYCRRCFKEGHDSFDMNDHNPVKYKRPK